MLGWHFYYLNAVGADCLIKEAGAIEEKRSAVAGSLDGFVHLALSIAFGISLSLVVEFLTSGETELHLAAAVFIEIDRERDQSESLLGLDGAIELVDLLLVHQQSAHSKRVGIESVALFVGCDPHTGYDELAFISDLSVALLDADAARAYRLDLGTRQYDARLKTLLDRIIVERFLVVRYYFTLMFWHNVMNYIRMFVSC